MPLPEFAKKMFFFCILKKNVLYRHLSTIVDYSQPYYNSSKLISAKLFTSNTKFEASDPRFMGCSFLKKLTPISLQNMAF